MATFGSTQMFDAAALVGVQQLQDAMNGRVLATEFFRNVYGDLVDQVQAYRPDNHFPEFPELTPELEEAWETWELHSQEYSEGLSEMDLERLNVESDAAMMRRRFEFEDFFDAVFGAPIKVATLGQ
jgi:hypothetical protein